MMKITIESQNFDLTPRIKQYVEEKISAVSKFAGGHSEDKTTRVDLSRDQHHRRGDVFAVKVNLALKGRVVYAKETGETVFAAVDKVEMALRNELQHTKAKRRSVRLRQLRQLKDWARSVFNRGGGV